MDRSIETNFNPESIEHKKAERFLVHLVSESSREIIRSEVLQAIEKGELSKDGWRVFGEQRYLAALSFEELLKVGIQKASEMGDANLAKTLQENLNDELGIDEKGVQKEEQAHATWRRNFYTALGISEESLENSKPLEGTDEYSRTLNELIGSGDALAIAGAVLILEHSIPKEFKKIQEGRDKIFRERFVENPGDPESVKEEKAKARLYIDDHIEHDPLSHYQPLLKALNKYAGKENARDRIQFGVAEIVRAKRGFYDSLSEALFKDHASRR